MKHPRQEAPAPRAVGSVSVGEILSLREFGRRLGLAKQALCDAQRVGLRTVTVGRLKFVIGSDAFDWFCQQAERQAEQQTAVGNGQTHHQAGGCPGCEVSCGDAREAAT